MNGCGRPFSNKGLGNSLGKEPWQVQVCIEGKENMEWVVDESSYKYQLQLCNQLHKGL